MASAEVARPKRWAKDKRTSTCQACGDDGVDWPLLRGRDLTSVDGMFEQLQRELIRHVFFTAPLDKVARENIRKLGVDAIRAGVREHLRKKIGQADIFRDGMQTPKKDRVVHFAQHATATCCRKCLDYWYDIPQGRELTDEELTFCEGLVHAYMYGDETPRASSDLDGGREGSLPPSRNKESEGGERGLVQRMSDPAFVVGLLVAALYFAGWTYYDAYFLRLGLNPAGFGFANVAVGVKGASAMLTTLAALLGAMLPLLVAILLLILAAFALRHLGVGRWRKGDVPEPDRLSPVVFPASSIALTIGIVLVAGPYAGRIKARDDLALGCIDIQPSL